jgi:hypothetical protein
MKALLCSLVALAVASSVSAQTYVTDDISTDTIWNPAGSPYVLQGQIWVLSSSTLTIEPGVVVEVESGGHLWIASGSSICAVGTQSDQILFTSASATPAPGDWNVMTVSESPSSTLSHCVLEYAHANLNIRGCGPTVSFCTMRHASASGLLCETGATCQVMNCRIVNNAIGVKVMGPSNPVINYCDIHDNSFWNLYASEYTDLPVTTINAESNWWGSDAEQDITDCIGIQGSSEDYVEVDCDPWLHESPAETASWGRIKAMFDK